MLNLYHKWDELMKIFKLNLKSVPFITPTSHFMVCQFSYEHPFTIYIYIHTYIYTFDFIECFMTTFLRAHSWLNWVDIHTYIHTYIYYT